MTKFKRTLVPGTYLTAADMLQLLSQQQLTAAAVDDCVMTAAEPAMAWLLDSCCVGTFVGECSIPVASQVNSRAKAGAEAAGKVEEALRCSQVVMDLHSRTQQTAATSGVLRATETIQQQYQQHQQRVLTRRQRRARRAFNHSASATVIAPGSAGDAVSDSAAHAVVLDGMIPPPAAAATDHTEHEFGEHCAEAPGSAPQAKAQTLQVRATDSPAESIHLVQLSLQEAFYLMHVLCCCRVFTLDQQAAQQVTAVALQDPQQPQQQQQQQEDVHADMQQVCQGSQLQEDPAVRELTVDLFWDWCCKAAGGHLAFVSQYAAYHHFRSKGWLPRSGLIYGADYILYQLHPEFAHSDYVVTVLVERMGAATAEYHSIANAADAAADTATLRQGHAVTAANSQQSYVQGGNVLEVGKYQEVYCQPSTLDSTVDSCIRTGLLWLDAHILQRLARQVLKQLLLLYVVVPDDVSLQSSACIQHLAVREVLVRRWVPAEHRGDGR